MMACPQGHVVGRFSTLDPDGTHLPSNSTPSPNYPGGEGFYSPHNSAGRVWSRQRGSNADPSPSFSKSSGIYKLYKYGFALASVALALVIVVVGTLLATRRLSLHEQTPLVLNSAAPLQSGGGVGEKILLGRFTLVDGANANYDLLNGINDFYLLESTKLRQKLKIALEESNLSELVKNVEIIAMENSGKNLENMFNVSFIDLPNHKATPALLRSALVDSMSAAKKPSSPFFDSVIPAASIIVTEPGSIEVLKHTKTISRGSTSAKLQTNPSFFTLKPHHQPSTPTKVPELPVALPAVCLDGPKQNTCTPGVVDYCKNIFQQGQSSTFYPNHLGMKSEAEVIAALSFFQVVGSSHCDENFSKFACALLQPQCSTNGTVVKLCNPFCEAVHKRCMRFFNATNLSQFTCATVSNEHSDCFQACSTSDFQCEKSNLCIPNTSRCDGYNNCGINDLSDERHCGCASGEIECMGTGKCILEIDLCNNYNDCEDWEDERNCTCEAGLNQCKETGQCLPERFWCDKEFHCIDKSDESHCPCADSDFRCQNGSYCLQNKVRCNGYNDCGDFSDEFDCTCKEYEFRCDEYLCKDYIDNWCNDRPDCEDGTDEVDGCECKIYQFTCANGQCIPLHKQCDGRPNCDDNSDESNCTCKSNEFDCGNGDECIAEHKVCDGVLDCPNGSDEHKNCTCGVGRFACNSGKCTSIQWWCDGHKDCEDNEDEALSCKTSCPSEHPLRCDTLVSKDISISECIHYTQLCDGVSQCLHNEDELNCTCKEDKQFQCSDTTCRSWSAYCNGVKDCPDGSDEPANCTCSFLHQLECSDGSCYGKEARCNTIPDCLDASDELSCTCADYLARSQDAKQYAKLCDGIVDCQDMSDELQCPNCVGKTFVCGDQAKTCLEERRVCDGITDCPNERDESTCYHLTDSGVNIRSWEYDTKGTLFGRLNGEWMPVCADSIQQFSVVKRNEFGAAVCKQLHQIEMVETSIINADNQIDDTQTFLEINFANATNFYLRQANCSSKSVIKIVCVDAECGMAPRASRPMKRIVGGEPVGEGKWPFYAAIYIKGKQFCGATVIDQSWILTAAHCFNKLVEAGIPMLMQTFDDGIEETVTDFQYDSVNHFTSSKQLAETIVVRLGMVRNSSYGAYEQNSRVTHVIRHSMYDPESGYNDIALLKLETPFKYSAYVMPACIANDKQLGEFGFSGDMDTCYTVGLGSTGWKEAASDILEQVQLPVMNSEKCATYPTINAKYKVSASQICAGFSEGGKDTCQGDSGGPLLCQDYNGHWTLIGVTSRGFSCAKPLTPGLYTKVAAFSDWINGVTRAYLDPYAVFCPYTNISCVLGDCLHPGYRCDGQAQCAFREDELNCPPSKLLLPTTTTTSYQQTSSGNNASTTTVHPLFLLNTTTDTLEYDNTTMSLDSNASIAGNNSSTPISTAGFIGEAISNAIGAIGAGLASLLG